MTVIRALQIWSATAGIVGTTNAKLPAAPSTWGVPNETPHPTDAPAGGEFVTAAADKKAKLPVPKAAAATKMRSQVHVRCGHVATPSLRSALLAPVVQVLARTEWEMKGCCSSVANRTPMGVDRFESSYRLSSLPCALNQSSVVAKPSSRLIGL